MPRKVAVPFVFRSDLPNALSTNHRRRPAVVLLGFSVFPPRDAHGLMDLRIQTSPTLFIGKSFYAP
jgi:hypothetical protein